MKGKLFPFSIVTVLFLSLVFATGGAFAQESQPVEPTTFNLQVAHEIKGDEIGLSKDAPVIVRVEKDGRVLTYFHMKRGQRIDATLTGGLYTLTFLDQVTADELFSCGPYLMLNGTNVRLQAHEKGAGRVPACYGKAALADAYNAGKKAAK